MGRDIPEQRSDMARVFLLPVFFLFLSISSIHCAPQFSGQLRPFYSFRSFTVVAPHGENARAPKPSSAPLRIEPLVETTAATTPTTTTSTTSTQPPPTTARPTTTTESPTTTTTSTTD